MTIDCPSGIDEARDWLGNEIDCRLCAHVNLLMVGKCRLKHACVHDRYARRIDRFFDWNPALANSYVGHAHFEVRAIAAKHADLFFLPPLLDDPDEAVRWNAVRRLPKKYLLHLRTDTHREVRIRVAQQLDDADLVQMMGDPDYYVRLVIARRIAPALLPRLQHDEEVEVRRIVARRIGQHWLLAMAADNDARVRIEVAQRLPADLLGRLQRDTDWRVRYEVANRIVVGNLATLLADSDPLVRELAWTRIETEKSELRKEKAI